MYGKKIGIKRPCKWLLVINESNIQPFAVTTQVLWESGILVLTAQWAGCFASDAPESGLPGAEGHARLKLQAGFPDKADERQILWGG